MADFHSEKFIAILKRAFMQNRLQGSLSPLRLLVSLTFIHHNHRSGSRLVIYVRMRPEFVPDAGAAPKVQTYMSGRSFNLITNLFETSR